MLTHIHRYPTPAHTYYLDATAGVDTNKGNAENTSWQTIAKVNASTFKPGDRILFKRGETWKGESLIVSSSGLSGIPIAFSNYGIGANPIIDSCLEYNDFIPHAGFIWKRNEAAVGDIVQAFEDGVRLIYAVNVVGMVAGSYTEVANVVYIWATDNGNPNTTHITEYAISNYSVDINAKSNIIFDGIDCTRAKVSGFYFQNSVGSTNITIKNLTVSFTGERSFNCGGLPALNLSNILVTNCIVRDSLDEGIWVGSGINLIVEYCTIYNSGKDVTTKGYPATHLAGGITIGPRSINCIARHNYVHSIYQKSGIYDEFIGGLARSTNTLIECNLVDKTIGSSGNGMTIESTNTIIRNNIIINPVGTGIIVIDDADGTKIYHNTLYSSGDFITNIALTKCTNVTVKNNLMLHANGTRNGIDIAVAGQNGLVLDYNQYYSNGAFRSRWGVNWYVTLATWKVACGQEALSAEGDPIVVTQWTNLHLQVTSPCIAAGDPTVGVLTDYDGVVRGAAVDIGAYEYV